MRVLVTGATGFLGRALVQRLRQRGDDIVALGRNTAVLAELRGDGIVTEQVDLIQQPRGLAARIGNVDAVVHCAAMSAPWGRRHDFMLANVEGTRATLDLARAIGARRFVNIGSPSVYFALRDRDQVAENSALPMPFNAYADSKAKAEALALAQLDLEPVSLRPRGIYGAGDTSLLPRLASAIRRGPLPLLRGGVAAIDLTHVSDVVSAIDAALDGGSAVTGQAFNISGGEQISVSMIAEAVARRTGDVLRWRAIPLRLALVAARAAEVASLALPWLGEPPVTRYALGLFAFRQSLDLRKARDVLGWSPQVSFARGLGLTFGEAAA